MPAPQHPVFAALVADRDHGPAVVAHRGDSEHFAENTLPAFEAALRLGVPMQEFDVRCTRDGVLVCIHDDTFDRTTDAATKLGPGALVAEASLGETRALDAAAWRDPAARRTTVPTLAEVLDLLLPRCIAMIEHKAGPVDHYLAELQRRGAHDRCIVQSFDWGFVGEAKRADPALGVAILGPTAGFPRLDASTIEAARRIGAGMVHWQDREVRAEDAAAAHAAGLLVCTYTTDDDVGFVGGSAIGLDAMCTNRPARMLELRGRGLLRRAPN